MIDAIRIKPRIYSAANQTTTNPREIISSEMGNSGRSVIISLGNSRNMSQNIRNRRSVSEEEIHLFNELGLSQENCQNLKGSIF